MSKNGKRSLVITETNMERLRHLLESAKKFLSRDRQYLNDLEEELDNAEVVPANQVPGDVVTMNSTVRVKDLDAGLDLTYTLVFPRDANYNEHKISVFAPIGTALLGYRRGDVIEWKVPAGRKRLKVEEILYQPEGGRAA
jgi:regulator of nucleoside diphosphate kinase